MAIIQTLDGGNIPSDRYVDITSGVGGASALSTRQLILRLFTTNELFPTNSVVTFTSPSDLLSFLNGDSSSVEYKQALQYFSYVSKSIRQPNRISFARWANVDTSAQVYGIKTATLDDLKLYTSADLDVTLGGSTFNASGIDFSTATTFADVANDLQVAIAALDASLASTTVVFDSASGGFNLDTNGTADGAISFASSTSGFLTDIGWDSRAVFSEGISAQSITNVLDITEQISNDFLSISFIPDFDITTDTNDVEVSTWVSSKNFKYLYCARSTKANSQAYFDDLGGFGGTSVTLFDSDLTEEYPWLQPAAESAAIDPAKPSSFPNYMFAPNSLLTAIVTSESEANTFDAIRMNYMGRTQEAGTELTWYQRGVLMGGSTDALTMSVYVGEAWLKADLTAEFLNMFNALPSITPDASGKAIITSYLDASVARALNNGVILVGKTLTTTQKAYITQVTGDDNAFQNVQTDGYWYSVSFRQEVSGGGVTEFIADYTLVYAKADKIRKVTGTHVLI